MTAAPPPGTLDPEISQSLEGLAGTLAAAFANLSDATVAAMRAQTAAAPAPALSDEVERTDHELDGRNGVWLRVHRPTGMAGPLPCIYWLHGGGLIGGDKSQEDLRFDRWCPELGIVGVAIDYRLAPEHPYPTPLEDCYAGLEWITEHSAEIGVDASRLGIGGSSAGGGLAAGLALLARDRSGPALQFQLLVYPMIDDRAQTVSSQWLDPVWPPSANRYGWSSYLGDAMGTDGVEPYAAPARAKDLAGLPPTLITVGALDAFSDEDIDFAVRLRHAGVPVELHVYPGAPHGFDSLMPGTRVARKMRADMTDWLVHQLA